jgi:ankyrin repeat protein
MEAGANPELHSNDGCCSLIRASNYGNAECVEILVSHNCNINIRSKNGNTALIKGIGNSNITISFTCKFSL